MTVNLLVTSISGKVPMLKAIMEACGKRGVHVFGGDTDPNCVGKYFVDEFWRMPTISEIGTTLGARRQIGNFLRDNQIRWVIPSRDRELKFWASYYCPGIDDPVVVMGSPPETVALCRDKLRFSELPGAIRCLPGRYVIKDQFGSGSKEVETGRIVQSHIVGPEFSVDVYCGMGGTVVDAVVRRRVHVVNGESQVTETVEDEEILAACAEISKLIGLRYHAVFQAIKNEGGVHIIECNPRFGGASTCALRAGMDSFGWFLDEQFDKGPLVRPHEHVRQVRAQHDHHWVSGNG